MSGLWKGLVGLVCLLLGVLGVRWMLFPHEVASELGIVLSTPVALNTARGDLGGTFVAVTILSLWGLVSGQGHWLQAVALVIGGVAFGRVVGLILDGFAPVSVASIIIEVLIVGILFKAAAQTRATG